MVDVIIRNFQAVKEAKFKIEGITVIQGESNAGKTACVRALYAAMNNRFKARQVRYGESAAEIKLRFSDRLDSTGKPLILSVKRSYTGGSPVYTLGDKRWSKLNRDMPNEILSYLNLGRVNVSTSEFYSLNFFRQNQAPLLAEFSQKKVMDVLSASQSVDDLNKVRKEIDIRRVKNKGAFEQLDAILAESKVGLTIVNDLIQSSDSLFERGDSLRVSIIANDDKLNKLEKILKEIKSQEILQFKQRYLTTLLKNREILIESYSLIRKYEDMKYHLSKLPSLKLKHDYLVELGLKKSKVESFESSLGKLDSLKSSLSRYLLFKSLVKRLSGYIQVRERVKSLEDVLLSLTSLSNNVLFLKDRAVVRGRLTQVIDIKDRYVKANEKKLSSQSLLLKLNTLKDKIENSRLVENEYNRINNIFSNNLCPYCERPLEGHFHVEHD